MDTLIIYQFEVLDFISDNNKLKLINNENSLCRVFFTGNDLNSSYLTVFKEIESASLYFLISDIQDYEDSNTFISQYKIKNYHFQPYLAKNNLSFFNKNIAVDFDDIISQEENIKVIESKAMFNPKLFGNIYVDYSGNIRMHPTSNIIGNITNNIYTCIFNEFVNNKKNIWFLTRNDVFPCKECILSLMCPSISGYELYAEKYNFCNVYKA